jgi:type II secretion system protein G
MQNQLPTNFRQPVTPARRTRGFTLLELLVVVAIIGTLAAIAIPAYYGYLDKAKRTMAISSMNTIRKTLESFIIDYGEYPQKPINFTTGRDNLGRTVFSEDLLETIKNDLFSIDNYDLVGEDYTVIATAKDSDHTVMTLTPQTLIY